MKKNKFIITMIFFIFFIILWMNTTSSLNFEIVEKQYLDNYYGNILYVGGTGLNNYSTIQSAINDTNPGDTVFVYEESSPYYENLKISKSIFLKGEDKNTTIIDGSGKKEVIFIFAENIEIRGFSVRNSSISGIGILIYSHANYVKIVGNIIKENYLGIFLYNPGFHLKIIQDEFLGPNENYLVKNYIINNTIGISLRGSNDNLIKSNWVENNDYGITITRDDYPTAPPSWGNRITKNVFIGNNKNAYDECNNRWISNYWDDWIGLKYKIFRFFPYRIPGTFRFLVNFDWFPAKEPITFE
ncbi:hypothetical protein AYK21_01500 [Thermoplasmatales archaeon SG8-52-2]|nr:MAG: hypothetical protein AYK21_01500 [Thermoplasmatales archaeon SG8-52-2]